MLTRLRGFLRASIGRKTLMSLTGLALVGFLIVHALGNLTLYADGDGTAFDGYAAKLEGTGLALLVAEIGLVALFVAHIALGMRTALENREARPARYRLTAPKGGRSIASTTMIVSGAVVLVFLVIHVLDFRLAERDPAGLAAMVVRRLSTPLGATIYLVGVGVLGVHLWQAFQSALQTLGLRAGAYAPMIRGLGMVVAVALAVVFATFPVMCALFEGKWPWS
jgi:succinate dehydrogenase / fumarate reductase cytochrome b subunit